MTLPELPDNAIITPDHHGAWVNNHQAQQGIVLGGGFCFWYVPGFHFHFSFDPNEPEGTLWQTVGGDLFDGGEVVKAGEAQIYPTEEGLRLVYKTTEFGKSAIDLIPLQGGLGETLAWVADDKRWGLTTVDTGTYHIIHYYCGKPDGQRWFIMNTTKAVSNVNEVQDGEFMMFKPIKETKVGEVAITVTDTLTMVGQIDGVEVDKTFGVLA